MMMATASVSGHPQRQTRRQRHVRRLWIAGTMSRSTGRVDPATAPELRAARYPREVRRPRGGRPVAHAEGEGERKIAAASPDRSQRRW